MKSVLDSRFIIEFFYSDESEIKQKSERKMRDLINQGEGIIPTIVLGETVQTICQKIGKQEAEICYANLVQSGLKIESLTPEIAKQAGFLRSKYHGVPMGDCIVAATAQASQAAVLSDDPHFDSIREVKRKWI